MSDAAPTDPTPAGSTGGAPSAAPAQQPNAFAAWLRANRPAGWALFAAILALAVVRAVVGGKFILTVFVLWCALWVFKQVAGDQRGA